jgi:hypothetical protein
MFDEFECQCVYVEISNHDVPNSGRVEYRAKQCQVCRARGSLLPADGKSAVAFASVAPRYQRMH